MLLGGPQETGTRRTNEEAAVHDHLSIFALPAVVYLLHLPTYPPMYQYRRVIIN